MRLELEILKEKERIFQSERAKVADCTRCHELCTTRIQTVFGEGSLIARVLICGEGPGAEENKQGKPFVGRAGQLLDSILKKVGLIREDVFIANILKCRPPNNRVPNADEITNCIDYLRKQIEVINPEFIMCLGSVASNTIVGIPISMARGKWFYYKHHKVICSWHPAYLLRQPNKKSEALEDWILLLKAMNSNDRVVQDQGSEEHRCSTS